MKFEIQSKRGHVGTGDFDAEAVPFPSQIAAGAQMNRPRSVCCPNQD
jgi:hypothetical protein